MAQSSGPPYAYVDIPELSETLANSVYSLFFDGQTLRITFAVNRLNSSQSPNPSTGKRYPVCRLVLTGAGIAELVNQVNQLRAALAQVQARQASQNDKASSTQSP